MNNRDLIENIARKLDKFTLSDITVISELNEQEVITILEILQKEERLTKRNDTYFYIFKSVNTKNNSTGKIILEDLPEYKNEYAELPQYAKNKVLKRIKIYNLIHNLNRKDTISTLKTFKIKCAYSTARAVVSNYNQFGIKGLFPGHERVFHSSIPDNIYEKFKQFYLTKEKLMIKQAIVRAVNELNKENGTNYRNLFTDSAIKKRLEKEFSKNAIKTLRETVEPKFTTKKEVKKFYNPSYEKKLEMLFTDAAKHYFRKIKGECRLEKLANERTAYKNHILPFFENYKIKDITIDKLREFKERKFNDGYKLSSVTSYLSVIKSIIRNISSDFKDFATKKFDKHEYDFIKMNILSKRQIRILFEFLKDKFPDAYPVIKLSLLTGANIPEILALTWKDINLENKKFHINKFLYFDKITRFNDSCTCRDLYFDDEISEILSKKENKKATDYVFKFNTQEYQQVYLEHKVLNAIMRKLNIKKLLPSDFVHNYVNLLLKQKVPVTYISRQCGISLNKFFAIYSNLIKEKEASYYNSLKGIC